MKITTIASGSSGNCYLIQSEKANVLIEAGVKPETIKHKTSIKLSEISAVLISHKHKDHSEFACKLASDYGIKIYANADTLASIEEKYIETEEVEHNKSFYVEDLYITPLKMVHDVDCLGFIIFDTNTKEKLLFFTDTSSLNYKLPQFDYIMAECNFDEMILIKNLLDEKIDRTYAERVRKTHFSIEKLIEFVKTQNKLQRLYIIHLSNDNSNAREFIKRLQSITGRPVEVC